MQIPDYRDTGIEGLIREYKKNAKPTQIAMKILEFYGGENCGTNEGAEMRRCIPRLVEEELVKDYQSDSEPDEDTRPILEERVGASWKEDQGVVGRSYILRIIKEEWGNVKSSVLLHHRELRGELGVGLTQNLKIELEPAFQHLFGKGWRDRNISVD